MNCSVLIPSRARPDGLIRAIHSLSRSADNPAEVEFLIRLDDDDNQSIYRRSEFEQYPNVHIDVGPRKPIHELYCPLYAKATGAWLTLFNDDAEIQGVGWDTQLKRFPSTGVLVQPETYQLNASEYHNNEWSAFPFFPHGCWKTFGWPDCVPSPGDTTVFMAAQKHKWKVEFLKGVRVIHHRKGDSTLPNP